MSEDDVETRQGHTLSFQLPGSWFVIDMADADLEKQSIDTMVREICGPTDEAAKARLLMRKRLQDACDTGQQAGARVMYFGREIAPEVPFPVVIAVYEPENLRMSPAVGVTDNAVLDIFRQGFEDEDVELIEIGGLNFGGLRSVVVEHDVSFDSLEPDDDSPEALQAYDEFKQLDMRQMTVNYWCHVPNTKSIILVTMSTHVTDIQHLMLELFDLIVQTAYFADESGNLIIPKVDGEDVLPSDDTNLNIASEGLKTVELENADQVLMNDVAADAVSSESIDSEQNYQG